MKRYKVASILMIIHGIIELFGILALIPIAIMPDLGMEQYFSFIVPYLQENLELMLIMGGIYGAVRLIGAFSLMKNKMWGLVLSIINCIITLALMIFMLPAGVMDGILASAALILMLSQFFGNKKAIE